jgi:hypothetical protein
MHAFSCFARKKLHTNWWRMTSQRCDYQSSGTWPCRAGASCTTHAGLNPKGLSVCVCARMYACMCLSVSVCVRERERFARLWVFKGERDIHQDKAVVIYIYIYIYRQLSLHVHLLFTDGQKGTNQRSNTRLKAKKLIFSFSAAHSSTMCPLDYYVEKRMVTRAEELCA